jgi:hypothetical protein
MMRISRCFMVGVWIAACFGSARAADDKVEAMTGDQTTARYQRKSITYFGISADERVVINGEQIGIVEKAIRNGIELKRFDYNEVNLQQIGSIDAFVNQLKSYVKAAATDRAAAEAEYEARFKSARVYFKDIDRIMNSAYFYVIKVTAFSVSPFVCPNELTQALLMKCTPGTSAMNAEVSATVSFYKANLTDESKSPYSLLRDVSWVPQAASESYESVPLPPPANAGRVVYDNYRAALASYNQRLPRIQYEAGLKAASKASANLAEFLSKEMKKVPEFQLLSPVMAALSDGVEFILGASEGLRLDDTYDVTEFDAAGTKSLIGYVKTRTIGNATGTGAGTPSYAEKVKEKRGFVGGELLVEHPMVGLSVGLHGVFELTYKNLIPKSSSGETELGFYPGIGFYVDKDIANLINWPEAYVSIEADMLFLLTDIDEKSWYLTHAMLGFKKKWYINSLVLSAGLRAGVSYYINSDYGGDNTLIGGGADIILGAEYYIKPELSVYLKAAGRFFTNPVEDTHRDNEKLDPELGVNASVGAFLAF